MNVAIIGATGLVGLSIIKVLDEENLPIENIYFYASSSSSNKSLYFKGNEYYIEELNDQSFEKNIDIAFFAVDEALSKRYAKIATSKGIIVIDNSSAWRMDEDVPLIVPEVNINELSKHNNLIANPNCTTIQAVVPLHVINKNYKIKRIVYSSYQSVSGSGYKGIEDLINGIDGKKQVFYPKQIAYNCIPHIDKFMDDGYTKEEVKLINETKKILNEPNLNITATCVRVPVFVGHCISINVECFHEIVISELIEKFKTQAGIVVYEGYDYPTPVEVSGSNLVHIGRIRNDASIINGVNLWVVADNVRKGAAYNAVQIAKHFWKEN